MVISQPGAERGLWGSQSWPLPVGLVLRWLTLCMVSPETQVRELGEWGWPFLEVAQAQALPLAPASTTAAFPVR